MTDLTNLLADIRGREEAATEGPWNRLDAQIRHTQIDGWIDPVGRRKAQEQTEHDIQFVMHARTDVPRLLAALEGVVALAEKWRYKGEFGWGAWQEGDGPDETGTALDHASSELRAAVVAALGEEA